VGAEEERPSTLLKRGDPVDRLLLEVAVADGERLVDDEHVGVGMRRHGEREAQRHPGGICSDGPVEELAELREIPNLRELSPDLRAGQAEKRRVHPGVLAARELGVEAHAELEDRRHDSPPLDRAVRGLCGPGDDLQERRLPGAVFADQAERSSGRQLEGNVPERVESAVSRRAKQELPEPVERPIVEPVNLRERIGPDREAVRQALHRGPGLTGPARTRSGGRGSRPALPLLRTSTAAAAPSCRRPGSRQPFPS
jgi:hypothetical protein